MSLKENSGTVLQVGISKKQTLRHKLRLRDLLGISLGIKTMGGSRKGKEEKK